MKYINLEILCLKRESRNPLDLEEHSVKTRAWSSLLVYKWENELA